MKRMSWGCPHHLKRLPHSILPNVVSGGEPWHVPKMPETIVNREPGFHILEFHGVGTQTGKTGTILDPYQEITRDLFQKQKLTG